MARFNFNLYACYSTNYTGWLLEDNNLVNLLHNDIDNDTNCFDVDIGPCPSAEKFLLLIS